MVRKHKGIHQSGKNAGRLKKGFIFTGMKSKKGVSLIKKVKKTMTKKTPTKKKKTLTGGENQCQTEYDSCIEDVAREDNHDVNCERKRLKCEGVIPATRPATRVAALARAATRERVRARARERDRAATSRAIALGRAATRARAATASAAREANSHNDETFGEAPNVLPLIRQDAVADTAVN